MFSWWITGLYAHLCALIMLIEWASLLLLPPMFLMMLAMLLRCGDAAAVAAALLIILLMLQPRCEWSAHLKRVLVAVSGVGRRVSGD